MAVQFDARKSYIVPSDSHESSGDGREIDLLHYIYHDPELDSFRDDPLRIIDAIDEFARTREYLMNIGCEKGRVITDLIAETKPDVMVELGGYIGYSCILFAHALQNAGGSQYYTFESNPEFAAVLMSLVDLAGLKNFVTVLVGDASRSLCRLQSTGILTSIDLLFLDHDEDAYLADLKICEGLGLLRKTSIVAANGIQKHREGEYEKYMHGTAESRWETIRFLRWQQKWMGTHAVQDGIIATKTVNPFEDLDEQPAWDEERSYFEGNPNLIYESQLVSSCGPTGISDGIEVSRCKGEQAISITELIRSLRFSSIASYDDEE